MTTKVTVKKNAFGIHWKFTGRETAFRKVPGSKEPSVSLLMKLAFG
jgi:hypothetical protein